MYAIDFRYDNLYLSDFNYIICNFDFSNGANPISAGSTITFNKSTRHNGKIFSLTSTQYDECISTTFDICKNPDIYDLEEMVISNDEYRDIMRWLNRNEFLTFQVIDDDIGYFDREACYFNASFNIEKIVINEKLVGMRLTMESDKPFGYGEPCVISWNADSYVPYTLKDKSDEIGIIYPDIVIRVNSAGDLELINETLDCVSTIKNCEFGELIMINGDSQFITTTSANHDICNDFNYQFFKIGNTYNNRDNIIRVSIPCNIMISYCPIIKDIPQ